METDLFCFVVPYVPRVLSVLCLPNRIRHDVGFSYMSSQQFASLSFTYVQRTDHQ
jgi:hypothetical protein